MKSAAAAFLGCAALVAAACGRSSSPAAPSTSSTSAGGGASSACSAISSQALAPAIVNGVPCSTANSPVVLLNMRDRNGDAVGACSGTVIAARAVLTAAHCLAGSRTVLVKVYRGSGLQVDSASFSAYPGYTESDPTALDVGVVLTSEDLQRPAMALLNSRDARIGEEAVVAGWGLNQFDEGTTLRAGFTVVSQVEPVFLQTQFTSTGVSGICNGDSGGPLLVSQDGAWVIAGITSALSGNACVSGTAFFASVRNADILSFIRAHVPSVGLK